MPQEFTGKWRAECLNILSLKLLEAGYSVKLKKKGKTL